MTERPRWAPTTDDLIALHDEVIKPEYGGGSPGIRSLGSLDAAAERPLTILFEEEKFPTHFDKAAALMDSIIRRLPFIDGNKRTAFAAAVTLIEIATGLAGPECGRVRRGHNISGSDKASGPGRTCSVA